MSYYISFFLLFLYQNRLRNWDFFCFKILTKKTPKSHKKAKHNPTPAFKRTNSCPLTQKPISKASEIIQSVNLLQLKKNSDQMPDWRKILSQTCDSLIFFANRLSPSLSFTSLRLCLLTHLPANYTDSRCWLEAYDKSVLLIIKMAKSVKGFGRDLGLGTFIWDLVISSPLFTADSRLKS